MRTWFVTCLMTLILLSNGTVGLAQTKLRDCERAANPVTELGRVRILGKSLNSTDFPYPIENSDARYISVRIKLNDPGQCNWYLAVRDTEFKLIQNFTREEFVASDSVWTARINGSKVILDLQQCVADSAPPKFIVAEYILMPKETKNPYYSKQGDAPRWKPLYKQDEQFRRYGDVVGFLKASWNKTLWSCTGVMIAADLFLTNWHCGSPGFIPPEAPLPSATRLPQFPETGYWNEFIRSSITIDLSWDDDAVSRDFVLTERGVVAQSIELDFAVLEVKPLNFVGKVRPAQLRDEPLGKESLWIVHHPLAINKQISNCEVVNASFQGWRLESGAVDFTHRCDTEAGSSGAPVFDARGRVVGLHHRGFDLDPKTCDALLPKLNKGVRIDEIIKHIKKNECEVYKRIFPGQLCGN